MANIPPTCEKCNDTKVLDILLRNDTPVVTRPCDCVLSPRISLEPAAATEEALLMEVKRHLDDAQLAGVPPDRSTDKVVFGLLSAVDLMYQLLRHQVDEQRRSHLPKIQNTQPEYLEEQS